MRILQRVICGTVILLSGLALKAQMNVAPFETASVMWGQKVSSRIGPGATTQFWFSGLSVAGRCYCAEVGNFEGAVPGTSTFGDQAPFTALTAYLNDGITVVATGTFTAQEPFGETFSRVCWIAGVTDTYRIKLTPSASVVPASAQWVTLHFVETTLFCPWFFVAGDYNAFTLLRNSSATTLSGVVVTWRGLNGTVAGTMTVSVPANGGLALNARDFVNPAVFSNGTIEVAHTGSPGQLTGSTTTLSATTGLGFDAQFTARPTW